MKKQINDILKSKRFIAGAIICLLLIIFILKEQTSPTFGKIFGKRITQEQFQNAYTHQRIQSILNYGQLFESLEPFLNLEQKAIEELILLHQAKRINVTVSNKELTEQIAQMAIFQKTGQFDNQLYRRVIPAVFATIPHNFEESIRASLIIEKLFNKITKDVVLTDNQLHQEYLKAESQFKLNYITILPKDLEKTVRFKDSDLKEYFQKNKIKFLSPPSMKLRYVKLPFPEDAGVQKQVETKFKAIAIYNEYVKKQGDLKQLAQKQNFTALDTRYFSIANPDIELGLNLEQLRNIFQMEKNLISQPIELTDGYLLAKMLDKKDTYIPAFNLIYEDIKNAYIADQAMALTKDKAVDILENIKKAMNKRYEQTTFVETITTLKLASEQTPLLAANEIIAYMGIEPDQKHKLFALSSENPLSDVIRTNQDYRIFYLEEKIAADETAFQEEKTEFTNNILTEIKNEKFADFVEEIKTKADVQIY